MNGRCWVGALTGAAGFGIGGALGGAIWVSLDAPHLGFAVMGLTGGAALAVMLGERTRLRTGLLALASALGFGIGFLGGFFVVLTFWEPALSRLVIGAMGGGIGGGALGLTLLRDWRKAGIAALVSALGFGLAVHMTIDWFRGLTPQVLAGTLSVATWGIAGGAALGAALGLLVSAETEPPPL